MQPATMDRLGFYTLPTTLEPRHAKAITKAREYATSAVGQLREHEDDVRRNLNLSEAGKASCLHEGLALAAEGIRKAFKMARTEAEADLSRAGGELQGQMWKGLDKPERLATTQASLLQLLLDDPVPSKYPTDPANGHAVLLAGGRTLAGIDDLMRRAPLEDARLVGLAALRADPFTRHRLGGKPVLDAMVALVRDRVIAEDPEAAKHATAMQQAETLLSRIDNDEQHALEASAKALGLPIAAVMALGKEDPVKEAAFPPRQRTDPVKEAARKAS